MVNTSPNTMFLILTYSPTDLFALDELSGLLHEFRSFGSVLDAPSLLDGPFSFPLPLSFPFPLLDGPFVTLLQFFRNVNFFYDFF